MSWKESDRMSEREEFIRLAQQPGANKSALCLRFGVSRKTGYKWLSRFAQEGREGLGDRSRKPNHSPSRSSHEIEVAVVELRHKYPYWGGRTLHKLLLQQETLKDTPSPSTITRILHRHGLISKTDSQQNKHFGSFERAAANDLWQVDFKGDFALSDKRRCYPLTILDDHSRYSIGIIACDNQRRTTVSDHFRRVFSKYGIPRAIYVDNGSPWGNAGSHTRFTQFSVWLMRQDIEVIHGKPYHPQGRGKIERFHRTLNREVLQNRHLSNLEEAQAAFDPWRQLYNQTRPHHALDLDVPASRYRMSERCFKDSSEPFEYSSRFEVRKIDRARKFSLGGVEYRFSRAFSEQKIGLSPTSVDGVWDIYYCRFLVAKLNQHTGQVTYSKNLVGHKKYKQEGKEPAKNKPQK